MNDLLSPQERLARKSQQYRERQAAQGSTVPPVTIPQRPVVDAPENLIGKPDSPLARRVLNTKTTVTKTTTVILPQSQESGDGNNEAKMKEGGAVERKAGDGDGSRTLSKRERIMAMGEPKAVSPRTNNDATSSPQQKGERKLSPSRPTTEVEVKATAMTDALVTASLLKDKTLLEMELAKQKMRNERAKALEERKSGGGDDDGVTKNASREPSPRREAIMRSSKPDAIQSTSTSPRVVLTGPVTSERKAVDGDDDVKPVERGRSTTTPRRDQSAVKIESKSVAPRGGSRTNLISDNTSHTASSRPKEQKRSSSNPPGDVDTKAGVMTDALFSAALMKDKTGLELEMAKQNLRAERAKLIEEREARMEYFRQQQARFSSSVRGDLEEDKQRLRADITDTRQHKEHVREEDKKKAVELHEREKFQLQAEFRAMKRDTRAGEDDMQAMGVVSKSKTPADIQAEAAKRKRDKKLQVMKLMMQRQRWRMIIGRGGAAITKANEKLRRAIVKEHHIEGARMRQRLGLPPEEGDELYVGMSGLDVDEDAEMKARPPSSEHSSTSSPRTKRQGSGRAGKSGFGAVRSLSPTPRPSHSRGEARSMSPTRLAQPVVELKSTGATIMIGDFPIAKGKSGKY